MPSSSSLLSLFDIVDNETFSSFEIVLRLFRPFSFSDFCRHQERKVNEGRFRGRPFFVRFVVQPEEVGERYGEPYRSFPLGVIEYGKAGVVGYGSLCGALNASAAAISLFHGGSASAKMITSLFTWYEQTSIPTFVPSSPVTDFRLAETSAKSILCHRSIGVWCEATGYPVTSKERMERCARVAADTSKRLTEILNDVAKGKPVDAGLPAITGSCLSCHGRDGELDNAKAKMNCSVCHDDKLSDHP